MSAGVLTSDIYTTVIIMVALTTIITRKKSGRFDKIRMISPVGYFFDSSGISDNFITSLIKYIHDELLNIHNSPSH